METSPSKLSMEQNYAILLKTFSCCDSLIFQPVESPNGPINPAMSWSFVVDGRKPPWFTGFKNLFYFSKIWRNIGGSPHHVSPPKLNPPGTWQIMAAFQSRNLLGTKGLHMLLLRLPAGKTSRGGIHNPDDEHDNGKSTMNENVSPIKNWWIFNCHVSLVGGFNPSGHFPK